METFHKREISHQNLKHWFEGEKRIFPWRKNPSPYAVWISEVMLQQTRATVVIPYFERWMERFPTIDALASASIEEVIKLWEGLGYYSRAKSLHEGARFVLTEFGGKLPQDPNSLSQIKGIGPYTVGAILSFAFHQKAVAVDGNVLRVFSRLCNFQEEIDKPNAQKYLRKKVEEFLPDEESWVAMEGLIELGASLCGKIPKCSQCPLQEDCKAHLIGDPKLLPKRKPRLKPTYLYRETLLIHHDGEFLIEKREGKGVMSGLYEFPYFEKGESWASFYPKPLQVRETLTEITHTFTRYRAHLTPILCEATEKIGGYTWASLKKMEKLPFSSGHKKIVQVLLEGYEYLTHRKF